MIDHNLTYYSRKGTQLSTLSHLNENVSTLINKLDKNILLDGEIFNHNWNFQEIVRVVKKVRPNSQEAQYWIFDLAVKEMPFEERYKILKDIFLQLKADSYGPALKYNNLVLVPNYIVKNEQEIMEKHEEFSKACGFEGTIIRNANAKYVFAHRTADLQKHKDFEDEEFEIIGGEEATGDDAGTIVFICKTTNGHTFKVRPKGSRDIRREWFTNINNIIGKRLTVRFQEKSEDDIPIFGVGIEIRDYE